LNHTFDVAARATVLAVHSVGERDAELAKLFGGETGDEIDKFARCRWHAGLDGVPILDDIEAWFAGRVLERVDFGDHVGHVLEPLDGEADTDEDNVGYQRVKDIDPGHAP